MSVGCLAPPLDSTDFLLRFIHAQLILTQSRPASPLLSQGQYPRKLMLCVAKKGEARLSAAGILSVSEVHLQTRHQQVNFQERERQLLTLERPCPIPGTHSL